jgi:hypothetical protein
LEDQSFELAIPIAFQTLQVVSAPVKEQVDDQERRPLVCVNKAVISGEGFSQRGGLLVDASVVAGVWAPNCGLDQGHIPYTRQATKRQRGFMRFYDVP